MDLFFTFFDDNLLNSVPASVFRCSARDSRGFASALLSFINVYKDEKLFQIGFHHCVHYDESWSSV